MRLIDADEYKERISRYPTIKAIAFKELRYVKTIDAEPIRHGHWIEEYKTNDGKEVRCSTCRMVYWIGKGREGNYCPHCGARMDGDDT